LYTTHARRPLPALKELQRLFSPGA
jgi:hypothetical protein